MSLAGERNPAAGVVLALLCVAVVTVTLTVVDIDGGTPDTILVENRATQGSLEHEPLSVEQRALAAVKRTEKAALALQTARQAAVRLEALGDTAGTASALRTEQFAKKTFMKARKISEPLVAEARANYEATQGTEIQKVAREVAQDTWRSMTGSPLRTGMKTMGGATSQGLVYGSLKSQVRSAAIEAVKRRIAKDYATEAQEAQNRAIDAQRKIDLLPPGSITHVAEIARIAANAKSALKGTQQAKAAAEAVNVRMLKAEADEKKQKLKGKSKVGVKASKTAADVIDQAETDVAASMQVVSDAATKRGMADHSWHSRIGDMMRNGNAAAAGEEAQNYVQKRINQAVSHQVSKDPLNDVSKQLKDSEKLVGAAAKRAKNSR